MLHGALPRTYLPPSGLCYLGGYYGETVHSYSPLSRFVPLDNSYITDHPIISPETRPISPIPLDLSLKPPSTPQSSKTDDTETIEVDDVEENNHQEVLERDKKFYIWESRYGPLEEHQSSVARAYHYYDSMRRSETSQDLLYSSDLSSYQSPSSSPIPSQKLLLTSPSTLRSMQSYQQQLLLTPQHHLQAIHAPMTPPSTPSPPQCPRRRVRDEEDTLGSSSSTTTPIATTPKPSTAEKIIQRPKKKHARRLKFDEDTSSPVSGTVILGPDEAVVTGDIDPAFNIVEVTEEARAELAKIENRLGPYQCKLCRQLHDDAFQLAQHRCSRIAHVEYRCPECDKRFSCPANLASHRRWHKPRVPSGDAAASTIVSNNSVITEISCTKCDAKFTRQAALRKHMVTQHPEANNNSTIINNNNDSINNNNTNMSLEMSSNLLSSKSSTTGSMELAVRPPLNEMP